MPRQDDPPNGGPETAAVKETGRLRRKWLTFAAMALALLLCAGGIYLALNSAREEAQATTATISAAPTTTQSAAAAAATTAVSNTSGDRLWYNENVTNILLVGYDYGNEGLKWGRSDSMIILSVNKAARRVTLVSLSRAAYAAIPGRGRARLNNAHAWGGPDLLIETVELNYKVKIDHYISAGFDSFTRIIDALGGVDIRLTRAEVNYLDTLMKQNGADPSRGAGIYHLNGTLALAYARTRAIDTDRARTGRQRTVLKEIAEKARSMTASQALGFLAEFYPLVLTDFTQAGLAAGAAEALEWADYPLQEAVIPVVAPPLVMRGGQEVLILNWDTVRRDIRELLYPGLEPQTPPA